MFWQNIKQYIRPGYNNQVNSITFLSPMNDQMDRNYNEKKTNNNNQNNLNNFFSIDFQQRS